MLVDLPNGRRVLIAGQKSGVVHAVDPDKDGAIVWQTRVGKGTALGGVQWGSAFDGRLCMSRSRTCSPNLSLPERLARSRRSWGSRLV